MPALLHAVTQRLGLMGVSTTFNYTTDSPVLTIGEGDWRIMRELNVTPAQGLFSRTGQMNLLHCLGLGNIRKQYSVSVILSASYN